MKRYFIYGAVMLVTALFCALCVWLAWDYYVCEGHDCALVWAAVLCPLTLFSMFRRCMQMYHEDIEEENESY